jgi:hypothetical protein
MYAKKRPPTRGRFVLKGAIRSVRLSVEGEKRLAAGLQMGMSWAVDMPLILPLLSGSAKLVHGK